MCRFRICALSLFTLSALQGTHCVIRYHPSSNPQSSLQPDAKWEAIVASRDIKPVKQILLSFIVPIPARDFPAPVFHPFLLSFYLVHRQICCLNKALYGFGYSKFTSRRKIRQGAACIEDSQGADFLVDFGDIIGGKYPSSLSIVVNACI